MKGKVGCDHPFCLRRVHMLCVEMQDIRQDTRILGGAPGLCRYIVVNGGGQSRLSVAIMARGIRKCGDWHGIMSTGGVSL